MTQSKFEIVGGGSAVREEILPCRLFTRIGGLGEGCGDYQSRYHTHYLDEVV